MSVVKVAGRSEQTWTGGKRALSSITDVEETHSIDALPWESREVRGLTRRRDLGLVAISRSDQNRSKEI